MNRIFFRNLFKSVGLITLILASTHASASEKYQKGQIMVQFEEQLSESQKESLLAKHSSKTKRGQVADSNNRLLAKVGLRVVEVPVGKEKQIADQLKKEKGVKKVQLDTLHKPLLVPNDPNYSHQWHLPLIRANQAWDHTTGSDSVILASIDTGVNPWQELAPLLIPGRNIQANNTDTSDAYGHGTGVAAIACATTNEGYGAAGVAWNCRIMPVRVSGADGLANASNITAGIIYAADHGAKVADVSYAVNGVASSAAAYMISKGGIVISPSGNDALHMNCSDDPNILFVGATNNDDTLATFSNYGNCIDFVAPGNGIVAAAPIPGYYSMSMGTCGAAAITSGVAILMFAANPTLSPQQAMQILKSTTDDLGSPGWDPYFGTGRINAERAVLASLNAQSSDLTPPTVSFSNLTNGSTLSGTVSVQVNATDNVNVSSVSLFLDDNQIETLSSAPYSFDLNSVNFPNSSHVFRAVATDSSGNMGSNSISVTFANSQNGDILPPTVSLLSPISGGTVARGSNVSITTSVSDNVGVVRVAIYVNGQQACSSSNAPFSCSWRVPNQRNKTYNITAYAYDAAGNTGTSSVVTVRSQ